MRFSKGSFKPRRVDPTWPIKDHRRRRARRPRVRVPAQPRRPRVSRLHGHTVRTLVAESIQRGLNPSRDPELLGYSTTAHLSTCCHPPLMTVGIQVRASSGLTGALPWDEASSGDLSGTLGPCGRVGRGLLRRLNLRREGLCPRFALSSERCS
jgi:hypothetical protein